MKNKKRIIKYSLISLLILIIISGLLSSCSGGGTTTVSYPDPTELSKNSEGKYVAPSGDNTGLIDGSGIVWEYKSETLFLNFYSDLGSETKIPDYDEENLAPWSEKNVKIIVIGEGITRIGSFAFYKTLKLNRAILPTTLEEIGESAFYNCNDLNGLFIPVSTKKIEISAFTGAKLETVYYGGYDADWSNMDIKDDRLNNNKADGKVVFCSDSSGFSILSLDVVAFPFSYILKFFNSLFKNYALALIGFAIVLKLILFPLGIKQQRDTRKMASFAPDELAIRNKYKGRKDQKSTTEMNEEIQKAKQAAGIPLVPGCLGMIIQLPVMFALYSVIRAPLRFMNGVGASTNSILQYRAAELIPGSKSDSLNLVEILRSNYEKFADIKGFSTVISDKSALPNFNLFGNGPNLGLNPGFTGTQAILLFIPVLVFASMFLSMKLTKKWGYRPPVVQPASDDKPALASMFDMSRSNIIMDLLLPLMSTLFAFAFPGILGLYWIYQSFLGIAQSYALKKILPLPKFTEADYEAAEQKYKEKTKVVSFKKPGTNSINEDDFSGPATDRKQRREVTTSRKHNPKSLMNEDYDDEPKNDSKN